MFKIPVGVNLFERITGYLAEIPTDKKYDKKKGEVLKDRFRTLKFPVFKLYCTSLRTNADALGLMS